MNNYDMMMYFNTLMNMMNQNQNQNNNMNNMNMYQMMVLFNQFMNDMNRMSQFQNNNMMNMNQMMMNFNNYINNNNNNNNINNNIFNNIGMNNQPIQQNNNNVITLIFTTKQATYTILTNYNETLGSVISKYIDMTHDYSINLYIHNSKKLNESLTVGEAGLLNSAVIYVVKAEEVNGA